MKLWGERSTRNNPHLPRRIILTNLTARCETMCIYFLAASALTAFYICTYFSYLFHFLFFVCVMRVLPFGVIQNNKWTSTL